MSCKPTYKGIRYNSLEELYRANGVNEQQKQQAQQLYSSYLQTTNNPTIEGFKQWNNKQQQINELFESNPELANEVYEALGFKSKPDVILPIGTSGSGKSTFIKSLPQENLVIIEPDAMRVEFTGDMNNKSKDKEIYIEAANRAIQAIKQVSESSNKKPLNQTGTAASYTQMLGQPSVKGIFAIRNLSAEELNALWNGESVYKYYPFKHNYNSYINEKRVIYDANRVMNVIIEQIHDNYIVLKKTSLEATFYPNAELSSPITQAQKIAWNNFNKAIKKVQNLDTRTKVDVARTKPRMTIEGTVVQEFENKRTRISEFDAITSMGNDGGKMYRVMNAQEVDKFLLRTLSKEGMYVFAVDGNNVNSAEVLLHITKISKINKNVKAANMSDFTSLPIKIKERILKRTLRSGYSDNVIMNASKSSPGFIIEFTIVPETEYSEPVEKIESISNETITLMDKITTDSNLVPVLFTNNNGALIGQGKDIAKIVDKNMSSVKYGNTNLELVKGDRNVVAIRMFEDFKNLSDNFVDVIQELITFAVNNADTQFVISLDEFINGETTIAGRRIADLVNALYDLKAKAPNVIIVSSENVQTGVLALSYAVMSLGENLTNNIC